jgi:hypothetical protein
MQKNSLLSNQVPLALSSHTEPTHNTEPLPISLPPPPPPSSCLTTMTNVYYYIPNTTSEDNNDPTDSFDMNDKMPDFSDLAQDIQNQMPLCVGLTSMDTALLQVLWNECEGLQHPLGAHCLGQSPPKGRPPKLSPFVTSFYEGTPQAGPRVCSC